MTFKKWESIKRDAAMEFRNRVSQTCLGSDQAPFMALIQQVREFSAGETGKPRLAPEILKEWEEYGLKLIDNWDVRLAGRLAECFPSCIPKEWQGRKLCTEMADNKNCDWIVYPVAA